MGAKVLNGSLLAGNSSLVTSAPKSAHNVAANGPAITVAMSRIRMPDKGPLLLLDGSDVLMFFWLGFARISIESEKIFAISVFRLAKHLLEYIAIYKEKNQDL
jgi:hypothetical protein